MIQRRRRKSAGYSGSSDSELTAAGVGVAAAAEVGSLSPSLDSALALVERSALRIVLRGVVVVREINNGDEAVHVLGRREVLGRGERLMNRSEVAIGPGSKRCIGNKLTF